MKPSRIGSLLGRQQAVGYFYPENKGTYHTEHLRIYLFAEAEREKCIQEKKEAATLGIYTVAKRRFYAKEVHQSQIRTRSPCSVSAPGLLRDAVFIQIQLSPPPPNLLQTPRHASTWCQASSTPSCRFQRHLHSISMPLHPALYWLKEHQEVQSWVHQGIKCCGNGQVDLPTL